MNRKIILDSKFIEIMGRYPGPAHVTAIEKDWLTGFIQGDGSFSISFRKREHNKFGFFMECKFAIAQHARSLYILDLIHKKLGCGSLILQSKYNNKYKDMWELRVVKPIDLYQRVFCSFNPQQLRGPKHAYYQILHQVCVFRNFMHQKQLTLNNSANLWRIIYNVTYNPPKNRIYTYEHLKRIAQVKLGYRLIHDYILRNEIIQLDQKKLTSMFVTGFTDAEGSFIIKLRTRTKHWPLIGCQLHYEIGAIKDSSFVLDEINKDFFQNQGKIFCYRNYCSLVFTRLPLILNLIIPFFEKNKLKSSKYYDYQKFVEAAELKQQKSHLTYEGIKKIVDLAFSSNTGKEGKSLRAYTKEQCLQYLALAPTREDFEKIRPNLEKLKQEIMISRHKQAVKSKENQQNL